MLFGDVSFKVIDIGQGSLHVMPAPAGDNKLKELPERLQKKGINGLVCLLEDKELTRLGLQQQKLICEQNGIQHFSFPIRDHGLPTSMPALQRFTHELYSHINQGLHAVIHCFAGIGRTGMIAACILLHHGLDASSAFAIISKARGIQVPDTEEQELWIEMHQKEIITISGF